MFFHWYRIFFWGRGFCRMGHFSCELVVLQNRSFLHVSGQVSRRCSQLQRRSRSKKMVIRTLTRLKTSESNLRRFERHQSWLTQKQMEKILGGGLASFRIGSWSVQSIDWRQIYGPFRDSKTDQWSVFKIRVGIHSQVSIRFSKTINKRCWKAEWTSKSDKGPFRFPKSINND